MLGIVVLTGWQFDIGVFKSIRPDLGAMAPSSAVVFVLAGMTLWLLRPIRNGAWRARLARALPVMILVISGLTFAEYLFHSDLGVDELFFADPERAVQTAYPGRMSMVAALGFLLLGLAMLLTSFDSRAAQRIARVMALATSVMSLAGLLGFLYGKASLYAMPIFSGVAVHTVAGLLLLAAGTLAIQPARGFATMLVSAGPGGESSRRLLPYAVVIPLVLGWLRLEGEQAGFYQTAMGVDLTIITMVVLLVTLIWWNARLLDASNAERMRAEAALREYADEVRDLYEHAPCGYHSLTADGKVVRINDTELSWLGYARDEIVGKLRFPDLLTPASQEIFRKKFPQFMADGEIRDVELELRRKDGSFLPVSVSATAVRDAAGEYVMSRSTVFDITERRRVEQVLRESEAAIRAMALTDALTGLANRRRLDETLRTEIQRVRRYGGRLTAIMTDLDHFKRINDEHGHQVGDAVLQEFARIIRSHCRDTDLAARFGGEEFMILMPEVGAIDAQACAERIRAALAQTIVTPLPQPSTASFGIAELLPDETADFLLRRVDKALYRGKAAGRNCVVVADRAELTSG